MNGTSDYGQKSALSDYLASERTVLAWIRTGLALMGFGFVVARFGLFLQQLQYLKSGLSAHNSGLSLWFGTGMIVTGVIVNVYAGWDYSRLIAQLDRGERRPRPSKPAAAIAFFLALIGLTMAIYLLTVRAGAHG